MPETSTATPTRTPSVSLDFVRDRAGFAGLEPAWNALLARHRERNPFLSFEWMSAWVDTVGRSHRLLVGVVRQGPEVVGIAPFCVDPAGELTFIGYPQSDYADVLADDTVGGVLECIVDGLREVSGEYRRALLNQWKEEGSHWREFLSVLEARGVPHRLELADPCPAMVLDDPAAAKKKYYKRNITTYVNWYAQQGEFGHEVYTDTGRALERLEDLFAQHVERWDGSASPSSFVREDMKAFYRSFMDSMHRKGWAKLTGLTLDDEDLALYLFFDYEGTMYLYKTSYNMAYRKRSPGQVILRFLFDYAMDNGVRKMDFVRGDEGYKARFANVSHQNRRILVYRSRFARDWAAFTHSVRYSRAMDLLYRNRRVQGWRYRVLQYYHRRKPG